MWRSKLIKMAASATAFLLACCSSGPDITYSGEPPVQQSRKVSIAYLKSLYVSSPVKVEEDIHVEGRIVSSDKKGNFYQTLCIEDETGGIALRVQGDRLFDKFLYGNMVSVSCNSLWLGEYGGMVQMGEYSADGRYQISPVPEEKALSVLWFHPGSGARPRPSVLRIGGCSERYLSCFVRFNGVQLVDEEAGMSWCDEGADTDRHITDEAGDTLVVRTSRHAAFASYLLPRGNGQIDGVLGWFNGKYQLTVIDANAADMDEERFTSR